MFQYELKEKGLLIMSGNRINRSWEREQGGNGIWKELNLSLKRELGGKTPKNLSRWAEGDSCRGGLAGRWGKRCSRSQKR